MIKRPIYVEARMKHHQQALTTFFDPLIIKTSLSLFCFHRFMYLLKIKKTKFFFLCPKIIIRRWMWNFGLQEKTQPIIFLPFNVPI